MNSVQITWEIGPIYKAILKEGKSFTFRVLGGPDPIQIQVLNENLEIKYLYQVEQMTNQFEKISDG